MTKFKFNRIFTWCSVILIACRTPIDVQSLGFQDLLVVESFISDLEETRTVILSRTVPLGDEAKRYERNSRVWIEKGDGTHYDFPMVGAGVYQSETLFDITPNESYKLFIQTADGLNYESTPVIVKHTPPIDSVFAYYKLSDGSAQISIATTDETGGSKYYRWITEETYELTTPFPAEWKLVSDTLVRRVETALRCFKDYKTTQILIETTDGKIEDRIVDFRLSSFHPDDPQLRTKYSILVKQYAIPAESYLYWSQIRDQNERQGGLFDVQPGSIQGNIVSTSNPDEKVLGYFDILTGEETRSFFSHSDIQGYNQPPYEVECESISYMESEDGIEMFTPLEALKLYTRSNLIFQALDGEINYDIVYINTPCGDCSSIASTTKPDFWND